MIGKPILFPTCYMKLGDDQSVPTRVPRLMCRSGMHKGHLHFEEPRRGFSNLIAITYCPHCGSKLQIYWKSLPE